MLNLKVLILYGKLFSIISNEFISFDSINRQDQWNEANFRNVISLNSSKSTRPPDCCPMVQISSEGPAKDQQSSSLSVYQHFKLNPDGRHVYRNSEGIYLYFNTIQSLSRWRVGSNYTLKEDTLYHSSCLSICPDQCNLGWSFFDIDIAWTPDNQVTVECVTSTTTAPATTTKPPECKTRADQITGGIPNKLCVFPFIDDGEVYTRCKLESTRGDDSWCATKVDNEGVVVPNEYGNCGIGCPGFRGYISPYRLSGLNGLCSDNSNETVEDKHECRIAFADMVDYLQNDFQADPENILHRIDEPFTSDSHPSGCIIQISGSTFTVRWNDISNGNRDSSSHQICKIDYDECSTDSGCFEREICVNGQCEEFQRFDCKADVGFLIDGSGSITSPCCQHNWNLIKDLILVLAKDLNITEDGAHMAVGVFSTEATLDIKFSDFTDYQSFEEKVIKLNHPQDMTDHLKAFDLAFHRMFDESTGMRTDVPKTLIFLTDGKCRKPYGFGECDINEFSRWGNLFRNRKIRLIGIGIGQYINEREIKDFVGESNYYRKQSFNQILTKRFRRSLLFCETCPLKFQRADSLYCDKDCGVNWLDNEYGCQGADADAFCRLKFCNNSVFARNFSVTPVSNLSGFSCKGNGIRFEELRRFQRVSSRFQIQNMGDIYFSNAMINTHGEGYVVANITCASMTHDCVWNEWKTYKCSTTCGKGVRRSRRSIRIPANFSAGGHCDNVTEIKEPCDNKMPCKRLGCTYGDVRITRKSFPQIFWKGDWRYICYTKFTENEFGANLFCRKFGYPSGKLLSFDINASLPIKSDKHDEDTFLMGGCKINDTWPDCTGSCGSKDLGAGCYQSSPIYNKTYHYSCQAFKTRKFMIKCNGVYDLPISSCYETKKTTTIGARYSTNSNTATSETKIIVMNSTLPQIIVASGQIRSILHQSLLKYIFIMMLILSKQ